MQEIILIIISYLLGSIPFGYIFTKTFSHKNILKIGWKKTSASNVMKNAGKLPGILTFIFDIGKGALAVWLAQILGYSELVQALCGAFAVAGHNWSIFLKFKGGRGLGTLMGGIAVINAPLLLISLIPCVIMTLVWTASIGTILSYFMVMYWSYSMSIESIFLMMALSLIPIIIKRIGSPKEIIKNPKLIFYRIIFDQDDIPDLRIKIG